MQDQPISPLRQRMLDAMAVRNFSDKTRHDYIRQVKSFASFLGRSPDTASADDLRRFQLHQRQNGVQPSSMNSAVSALRFFFSTTLDRPDMERHLTFVREPRKIPVILSPQEIGQLLEAAPGPKYKAAMSAAYSAGLRVSEVVALKVADVDSKRMLLRIEQGKGRKDRLAMLSPRLLDLLRDWYCIARPAVWLFPGRDPMLPMTTRQLTRAVHMAARHCRDRQAGHAAHAATQLCHPSVGAKYRYSPDPGFAWTCEVGDDRALHSGRHQRDPRRDQPARSAHTADPEAR